MKKISAGLLMYRIKNGEPEVLLVHPGGPFFKSKDDGCWSIPKGLAKESENDLLEVAKREFEEETSFAHEGPYLPLGFVKRKDGKEVHGWAFKGDANVSDLKSNTFELEWPPKSGKKITLPEVDRGEFFTLPRARQKLSPFMVPLIDAFSSQLQQERVG